MKYYARVSINSKPITDFEDYFFPSILNQAKEEMQRSLRSYGGTPETVWVQIMIEQTELLHMTAVQWNQITAKEFHLKL